MNTPCIICENKDTNTTFVVKELYMGLNETFNYQQCSKCGSLQLLDIPPALGKYYSNNNYYSFNQGITASQKVDRFRKAQADYLLFNKNKVTGGLFTIGFKMPDYYHWMKNTGTKYTDAILDVGTGNGSLLTKLSRMGFTNLTGIDPFINESKDRGLIKILKMDVFEVREQYDTIMMHHSLEHMFEPKKVLQQLKNILNPGGKLLIRIPVMGNYGWKKYGICWSGIDAPRHIFIPTENALRMMMEEAGFKIEHFEYDSNDFIIWSSEQYLKGMALQDPKSYMINPRASIFTKTQINEFRKIIQTENEKGNGDTAAIYLQKK